MTVGTLDVLLLGTGCVCVGMVGYFEHVFDSYIKLVPSDKKGDPTSYRKLSKEQ